MRSQNEQVWCQSSDYYNDGSGVHTGTYGQFLAYTDFNRLIKSKNNLREGSYIDTWDWKFTFWLQYFGQENICDYWHIWL